MPVAGHHLLGAATLLAAAALFWQAYRAAAAERTRVAVACILGAALLLRFFAALDPFLHAWDERYHALVAKNLMAHPLLPTLYDRPLLPYDLRSWGSNHVWLHKPPLALWLMAASMKAFGVHEIALRLPSILLSTAAVWVTYEIGKAWVGRRAAVWAAFLHAVNGFLLDLAAGRRAADHVDTLFIFLIALGILAGARHARSGHPLLPLLIGCLAGLALLAKFMAALLIFPVWMVLLLGRMSVRRALGALAVAFAAALVVWAPWQLYARARFPLEIQWEAQYNWRHLTEVLEEHGGDALFFLRRLPSFFGALVFIPLAWFFYRLFKGPADRSLLALAVWFVIPYGVFSFVATKMPGYVMIAAPALFLIQGRFLESLRETIARMQRGWWQVAATALLVLCLLLPAAYGIERLKPFQTSPEPAAWTSALRSMAQTVGEGPTVLFNTPSPIETMFFTDWTAYSKMPAVEDVSRIRAQGYRVLIEDDGKTDFQPWRELGCEVVDLGR